MAQEEDVFVQRLLDGLDSSTRTKHENHADNDLSILLDGAENWDWTDMEADFLTPKKKTVSPNKARTIHRQRSPHKRHRSPAKPPVTPRRTCSVPSSAVSKHDLNLSLSDLLDGAETWDWQDMESDFLSPPRKRDKLKVRCTMSRSPLFLIRISV
jgi:DNA replication ATP-dependent helicase Dna2